ncbi:MAG: hypothetical protein ACRCW1_08165 [Anaerotignaceae bacterium]
MNPKEKAAYLIVKYMSKVVSKRVAIECALVAVDEFLNEYHGPSPEGSHEMERYLYFKEVKEEIQKA